MYLDRFCDNSKIIVAAAIKDITTENEKDVSNRLDNYKIGEYDILDGKIHAIFSIDKDNFLLLDNLLIKLSANIEIDYYCDFPDKESEFKIFENGLLVYEIKYHNNHSVLSFGNADPDIFNFADRIAAFLRQIKVNANAVLF